MTETETRPAQESPATARPRLGFAGVGWIGRHRLEAIAQSGLGEVAAIFDPTSEALEKAAAAAPEAVRASTFEDLLDLELDGVVIATPNALHARQAKTALLRGKAVFCQKPLGRSAPETREVIGVAREANRLLHVDLSYRFTAGMQRMHELARSGALGRIYAVEAVFHNAYGPDKPWFYDAELAGGGCLLDLGIHLLDLTLWCLDYPEVSSVTGHLLNHLPANAASARRVEDYAAAQLLLASGASVQLACSWKAAAGRDAEIGLTLFGTEGGARFANVNGSFYEFAAERFLPDRTREPLAGADEAWGGRAAIEWCRRLGLSNEFDPDVEKLGLVAETLDRIYGRIP